MLRLAAADTHATGVRFCTTACRTGHGKAGMKKGSIVRASAGDRMAGNASSGEKGRMWVPDEGACYLGGGTLLRRVLWWVQCEKEHVRRGTAPVALAAAHRPRDWQTTRFDGRVNGNLATARSLLDIKTGIRLIYEGEVGGAPANERSEK